jgi:hypothetical protein
MNKKMEIRLYAVIIIFIFLLFFLSFLLDMESCNYFLAEDGPVEMASAVLYFICFLFVVYQGGLNYFRKYFYLGILPLLFGLRELDFDKRFTTMGVLKKEFYLEQTVPFTEKLAGLAVIAVLLFFVFKIIRNHGREFLGKIKIISEMAGVKLLLFMLVFAKMLDGSGRKFFPENTDFYQFVIRKFTAAEELIELGIPMVMLVLFTAYFSRKRAVY